MSLKILIAPDKFKGTLTAGAVAEAIARGWRRARPGDTLHLLPMSDGGDGFGEVLGRCLGARVRRVRTVDAAHRSVWARWWWDCGTKTAVIESTQVIGLANLPPGRFHPFELDTFGLGTLLREAERLDARQCIVGVGGSATNDGGFGVARALGWRFLDANGEEILNWIGLGNLVHICAPESDSVRTEIVVAVDVQNPLLGVRGATRVYGPQKGLRGPELKCAEQCLRRLAHVFAKDFKRNCARAPGAGAAGGLGFGLAGFARARLTRGFELYARHADLDRRLREADIVITGEGKIDRSTVMGKGVGQIARMCHRRKIQCIGLAGQIDENSSAGSLFALTGALVELTSPPSAEQEPESWLEILAEQMARRTPLPVRLQSQ